MRILSLVNHACTSLLVLAALVSCNKDKTTPQPEYKPDPVVTEPTKYSLKKLEDMTLREKVGQLFNIRPEELFPGGSGYVEAGVQDMKALFKNYPCGSITLFAGNIKTPQQTIALTTFLHGLDNYPLLCIDEEGGRVARIGKNSAFPITRVSAMGTIGSTGNPENAYNAGNIIGEYLLRYGFDVDLAPVSDVNTNPDNVVIGDRAFGSSPELVASMVARFLPGLQNNKVEGCLKHFPGHGDTTADTHYGYAESLKTWDQLKECEMLPFQAGINAGVKMIMTAHVCLPNVVGAQIPSTLSSKVLQDILRKELGYSGIIITDSMAMGAITKEYSADEAAIAAIKAGVDIVLDPANYQKAFDAVVKAVEEGEISEQLINERAARVLSLKKDILTARGQLKD